ncbi:MAG: hypothetical protein ACQEP1_03855 [Nanobdellota archaeon]
MKVKIVEKQEQPLLSRTELKAEVEFDKEIPSRQFMREQVAKAVKGNQEMIIIERIVSKFSSRKADVFAHVYKDKAKMEKFVRDYMKKRHVVEEKKENGEQ